jgi:hypothetical protein
LTRARSSSCWRREASTSSFADLGDQQPLAIGHRELCRRDLLIRHGDTPVPAKQIERPFQADRRLVVAARRLAAELRRQRGIPPQLRLLPHSASGIDRRPCRANRRLLRKRTRDGLIERET